MVMTMFKIGDFSRLTRVPIRTLHHYDEIGLFRPAEVDRFTGYRYYSFDQLPRLNRILALRGLGFSLEQIRTMLGGDGDQISVSADELGGMLKLRRAQLQQEVDETLEKLAQVEIRLKQIENEGSMSTIEVLTKNVAPILIVGAREVVSDTSQMRERCIALNDAACGYIKQGNLKTDWVSLALYYNADEEGIDVEMGYEVESPGDVPDAVRKQLHFLPAATLAYAVYRGSYDDFGAVGQLHNALVEWIGANGYAISGASREYYLQPPQSASNPTGVMEIQYPVEKV